MNKELLYQLARNNSYDSFNRALMDELGTDDIIILARKKETDMRMVLMLICNFYKVNEKQVLSKSRERRYSTPRMMFSYYMRVHGGRRYQEIGAFINKDHASVIHHVRTITTLMEVYPEIHNQYYEMCNYINGYLE